MALHIVYLANDVNASYEQARDLLRCYANSREIFIHCIKNTVRYGKLMACNYNC